MTNEEAKNLLQNNLDFENGKKGIYPCPIEQYKLALEVAIEALETHDDLCSNLAWYINERQRLLKVIEYSKPNEGLQRTIQKALERPHGEWIGDTDLDGTCKCSACRMTFDTDRLKMVMCDGKYEMPPCCPNCGSVNRKREGEEK